MCLQNKHPCNCNFSPMNKHIILRYEKALYYYVEIKTTNKAGSKHNKPFALVVPVIGQCKVYIQCEGSDETNSILYVYQCINCSQEQANTCSVLA